MLNVSKPPGKDYALKVLLLLLFASYVAAVQCDDKSCWFPPFTESLNVFGVDLPYVRILLRPDTHTMTSFGAVSRRPLAESFTDSSSSGLYLVREEEEESTLDDALGRLHRFAPPPPPAAVSYHDVDREEDRDVGRGGPQELSFFERSQNAKRIRRQQLDDWNRREATPAGGVGGGRRDSGPHHDGLAQSGSMRHRKGSRKRRKTVMFEWNVLLMDAVLRDEIVEVDRLLSTYEELEEAPRSELVNCKTPDGLTPLHQVSFFLFKPFLLPSPWGGGGLQFDCQSVPLSGRSTVEIFQYLSSIKCPVRIKWQKREIIPATKFLNRFLFVVFFFQKYSCVIPFPSEKKTLKKFNAWKVQQPSTSDFPRAKIPLSHFTVQTPYIPAPYKFSNPIARIPPARILPIPRIFPGQNFSRPVFSPYPVFFPAKIFPGQNFSRPKFLPAKISPGPYFRINKVKWIPRNCLLTVYS